MFDLCDLLYGGTVDQREGVILIPVLPYSALYGCPSRLTPYARYDARLLLDNLPPVISNNDEASDILGWADLPSDAEDTFFLAPDEVEDYQRQKRRRLIEQSREDRLRAICADDPVDNTEVWGGSDEEVRFCDSPSD